jgi:hypothetical protein
MPNLLDGQVSVTQRPASDRAPNAVGDDVSYRYGTKEFEFLVNKLANLPPSQQMAVIKELEGLQARFGVTGSGKTPFERIDAVSAGLTGNVMGGKGRAEIMQGRQGPPSLNFSYSKSFKAGGKVSRGDGIAKRGKTKGRII